MARNAAWAATGFDAYQSRAWRFLGLIAAGAVLAAMVVAKAGGAGGTAVSTAAAPTLNTPVSPAILANLRTAAQGTLSYTGGANPLSIHSRLSKATGAVKGGPTLLYVGGEYCPYCAAMRWSLVLTLMRFGRLSGLEYMASSAQDVYGSTPTFTFAKAKLVSPYMQFQGVEAWSRNLDSAGTGWAPLETPTAAQLSTLQTYDAAPYVPSNAAGDIPFVDVANRYLWVGAPFFPTHLTAGHWAQIAQGLAALGKTGTSTSTEYGTIARTANILTAAVCSTNGNTPASVCSAAGVVAAKGALPK